MHVQNLVLRPSANLLATVTGTPTGVAVVRTGCYTVQLSWTPPANNAPPVAGYEVFYAVSGSDNTQSGGNTNSTNISMVLPTLDVIYDLFVVAYSDAANTLPSAYSTITTIDLSEFISCYIE